MRALVVNKGERGTRETSDKARGTARFLRSFARKFTSRERHLGMRQPSSLEILLESTKKVLSVGWSNAANLATGSKVKTTLQESMIHPRCENVLFSFENGHFLERPMCLMD